MDQSTEKLLKSSNTSDSPLFGISNYYDSSPSITYDLATNSPEQSLITDTLPTFTIGAYHRTRHLSCILENWSESESYNSLPTEVTQQSDDSFNAMLDQKPMCWEAEDVSEYITTLDESCILDIESIEQIDKISDQETSVNPWSNHTWPHRASGAATQKMVTVDIHATDKNDVSAAGVKSGGPVLKYPKIMTTSCYGALSNPFVDKSSEDVSSVHKSSDELIDKTQLADFLYLNPLINNHAKCRSPLPASLSNSFIDGTTSMNVSFTEPKSMQSSIEFSGMGGKATTINPLEISMNLPDGSKYFGEEAVGKFEEVVDNDLQAIRKLLETETGGLICPSCQMPFDKGKKRKLIDNCGHERCYSCMFKNEQCPVCKRQELEHKREMLPCNTRKLQDYDTSIGGSTTTISPRLGSPQRPYRSSDKTNGFFETYMQLVVKKSEPSKVILNGRAALCAGRDDMSSDDEERLRDEHHQKHRFNKPDNFKTVLESGAIPDAAMIHAARKRRQKAREQGDFIPIQEDKPPDNRKGRLVREGDDDLDEDEERVDMSAINGAKEREERREKFYSVQQEYSGDDSDAEINEWENQQIRKGVTGAQLVTAHQESAIYSQYLIKPAADNSNDALLSTGDLLEQAYAKNSLEKPRQMILSTQKKSSKPTGPRMPKEVVNKMKERLTQVRELHNKHLDDIDQITTDLQLIKMDELYCEQNAPIAAIRYRFYQELRGYVTDLVECLDEKVPSIVDLERRMIALMSKQAMLLIERRRQDVRDQAKEMTEIGKPGAARKMLDDEEQVRRAADREGRRTRRRQIRERIDINNTHLDGMSSDDEIHQDRDTINFKTQLEQISTEVSVLFEDVTEDFSQISLILKRCEEWRRNDFDAYKDTYFSLCLPKILGPLIRLHLVTWNPFDESCEDLERMDWYAMAMKYGWNENETEESLMDDPDVKLVPVLIEKIILPKVTELIETCWDPLSTSQTLKLVGLIGRLGRDYPSLKATSKYLRTLFSAISDKMKLSLDNDVFIPVFPKQSQEARSSFFQRQFCSGLKLFRNVLSFQGILADSALKEYAILSLLNRYLLMAMRVCTPVDATSKAYIIINTLPRIWLQPELAILESLGLFITYLKSVSKQLDKRNQIHVESIEKMSQILHSLHVTV